MTDRRVDKNHIYLNYHSGTCTCRLSYLHSDEKFCIGNAVNRKEKRSFMISQIGGHVRETYIVRDPSIFVDGKMRNWERLSCLAATRNAFSYVSLCL